MCQFLAASIHRPEVKGEWDRLLLSDTVTYWLVYGVPILFNSAPAGFELRNHKLSRKHEVFIDQEINELLRSGAIEKHGYKPYCVSPIGMVPKKNDKLRLITDLSQLNTSCSRCSFQYEDVIYYLIL